MTTSTSPKLGTYGHNSPYGNKLPEIVSRITGRYDRDPNENPLTKQKIKALVYLIERQAVSELQTQITQSAFSKVNGNPSSIEVSDRIYSVCESVTVDDEMPHVIHFTISDRTRRNCRPSHGVASRSLTDNPDTFLTPIELEIVQSVFEKYEHMHADELSDYVASLSEVDESNNDDLLLNPHV